MNAHDPHGGQPHTTVADLHLPPTFVADHVIRMLSYQGTLTPVEVARAMHVPDSVAQELLETLRGAGVVQLDSGQANFDRFGRIRLSDAGQARVASARQRTWYAGALPVSLADFTIRSAAVTAQPMASAESFRAGLADVDISREAADAIGPAVASATTVCIDGVAPDEHQAIASALGRSLAGSTVLPYALFAAGAVIRLFDPAHHQPIDDRPTDGDGFDILRSVHDGTQWATVIRPSVTLTGGILASDVVPAYDEDAKFYVAPSPLAAAGGLLSVTDAAANPGALIDLARLWLIPGRHHTGIILLRSGERVEVPWRTATALIGVAPERLPEPARGAVTCSIDIGAIFDESLLRFLGRRLDDAWFPAHVVGELASRIASARLGRRRAAAAVCSYLGDRAAYEGAAFSPTDEVLNAAIAFAQTNAPGPSAGSTLRAA